MSDRQAVEDVLDGVTGGNTPVGDEFESRLLAAGDPWLLSVAAQSPRVSTGFLRRLWNTTTDSSLRAGIATNANAPLEIMQDQPHIAFSDQALFSFAHRMDQPDLGVALAARRRSPTMTLGQVWATIGGRQHHPDIDRD